MVGILCGVKKERELAEILYHFLQSDSARYDSAFIFPIENIHVAEKTAVGSMVSCQGIQPSKSALPALIFNLSVQHTWPEIRKLRNLAQLEDITILNQANRYSQRAIMQMLSSGAETRDLILPYQRVDEASLYELGSEKRKIGFAVGNSYIFKPEDRADLDQMLYIQPDQLGFDLYDRHGIGYYHLYALSKVLRPLIRDGRWLLLRVPGLAIKGRQLWVLRYYLYKTYDGRWTIGARTQAMQDEKPYEGRDTRIETLLDSAVRYIGLFIPDLVFCFIDLIFRKDGVPYFLNFGGWNEKPLSGNAAGRADLYRNILEYSKSFFCK